MYDNGSASVLQLRNATLSQWIGGWMSTVNVSELVRHAIQGLLVAVIGMGVSKMDRLTDKVETLNIQVAQLITRSEYIDQRFSTHKDRLDKITDRLTAIETRLSNVKHLSDK